MEFTSMSDPPGRTEVEAENAPPPAAQASTPPWLPSPPQVHKYKSLELIAEAAAAKEAESS